jgi:methylated-DNA-[protein]-cysteine S-methyltransferase
MEVQFSGRDLVRLWFVEEAGKNEMPEELLEPVQTQVLEFLEGNRVEFDLPFRLLGTDFQLRVWEELRKIPYAKTISYKELACRLGDPKSIRAAATANGANPIALLVPCHRVIGSDGSLIGYAGGLQRKKMLLEMESGRGGEGQIAIDFG